jgi:hypothetical protein
LAIEKALSLFESHISKKIPPNFAVAIDLRVRARKPLAIDMACKKWAMPDLTPGSNAEMKPYPV